MAADVLETAKIAQVHPVVAVGHSAGGQLALWLGAQDAGVDAVVALAPVADLRAADALNLSGGAVRVLLGGSATDLPTLYDAASPQALLPLGVPQLVVHGDADESVPQHISIDYATAATAAGDDLTLLTPAGVNHMQIIDPGDDTWRSIEGQLMSWFEG
jgi:pimeloyl-ACP methyl ester carboxylesterase